MLQAWDDNPKIYSAYLIKRNVKTVTGLLQWGYVKDNIYFEDPVLDVSMRYINIKELDTRLHDYVYLSEKCSKQRNRYHSDHYKLGVMGIKQGSKKSAGGIYNLILKITRIGFK